MKDIENLYTRLPFILLSRDDSSQVMEKELMIDYINKDMYIKTENGEIKVGENRLNNLLQSKKFEIMRQYQSLSIERLNDLIVSLELYKTKHEETTGDHIDTMEKLVNFFKPLPKGIIIKNELDKLQDISDLVLTTNNYTNDLKNKLKNIEIEANRYTHPIDKQCNYNPKLLSVNGNSGIVTLTKHDLGLGLVEEGANLYEHPPTKQCGKGVITVYGKGGKSFLHYGLTDRGAYAIDNKSKIFTWGEVYNQASFNQYNNYIGADLSNTLVKAAILRNGSISVLTDNADLLNNIPMDNGYSKISCGNEHIAVIKDGVLTVWGTPQDEIDKLGEVLNVSNIVSKNDRMLILSEDGKVALWGYGAEILPKEKVPDETFLNMTIGYDYQYAGIISDNSIKVWGNNTPLSNPIIGNNFIDVALSMYCGVAVKNDGTLAVWGDKTDTIYRSFPKKGGYISVKCGTNHCTVMNDQGIITTWGDDDANQITDTPSSQIDITIEKHHVGLSKVNNFEIASMQDILKKVNDKYITTAVSNSYLESILEEYKVTTEELKTYKLDVFTDPPSATFYLMRNGKWISGKSHNLLYSGRYIFKAINNNTTESGAIIIKNSNLVKNIQLQKYTITFTNNPIAAAVEIMINGVYRVINGSIDLKPGQYEYKIYYGEKYIVVDGMLDIGKNTCVDTYEESYTHHSISRTNSYNVKNYSYDIKHALERIYTLKFDNTPRDAIVSAMSRNDIGPDFLELKGTYKYKISRSGYKERIVSIYVDRDKTEKYTLVKI